MVRGVNSMLVIQAEGVTKIFDNGKKAVDGLNLRVEQGTVFGFLGPNGAGKTTTVKLLNGILKPDSGSILIHGYDPVAFPSQIHAISGVLTEHAAMYDDLSAKDNLVFYGQLYGASKKEAVKRAEELLELLDLAPAKKQLLGTFSTGMRQRLSLARALINRPSILFLDEPTSGLDPESAKGVNELIQQLAKDSGTTIFLCTHQLRYAQEICTEYGLIDDGQLLATGSLDDLRALVFNGAKLELKSSLPPDWIPCKVLGPNRYQVDVLDEYEIPTIVSKLVTKGADIFEVSSRQLSLEEIYFALVTQKKVTGKVSEVEAGRSKQYVAK